MLKGERSVKKFTIKDPNNNGLTVDDKGVLNFTKWSETSTTVTVSESPTRLKNSASPVEVSVKIEPIKSKGLTAPPPAHFRIKDSIKYQENLANRIGGRDLENNTFLPLKFTSTNPSIVEVSIEGDIKIKNHGAETFIDVLQKATSLHSEQTCRYSLLVVPDITETVLTLTHIEIYPNYVSFKINTNNSSGEITTSIYATALHYPNSILIPNIQDKDEITDTYKVTLEDDQTFYNLNISGLYKDIWVMIWQAPSKDGFYPLGTKKYIVSTLN